MTDLVLERILPAKLEDVFAFITQHHHLLTWWGPEELTLPEENLDFTKTGPWFSVMRNNEGQQFKVSGHVTSVDPLKHVAFTWGWHDESDQRGHESHVMIEVSALGAEETKLVLTHRALPDDETREHHNRGWTSSLRKLEKHFGLD